MDTVASSCIFTQWILSLKMSKTLEDDDEVDEVLFNVLVNRSFQGGIIS